MIAGRSFRPRLIVGTGKIQIFPGTRACSKRAAQSEGFHRRRVIEERYRRLIDELYAQADAATIP